MLNRINDRLLMIRKCLGLEIVILPGDKMLFSGVILRLEKNKVHKEKEFHFLTSFEELIRKCGVRLPVAVSVNGKGILQKKISLAQLADGSPLKAVLPNANPNDLYVSVTRLDEFASVAVARREVLDKLLADLEQHGFHVLVHSIGIESVLNLLPFITLDRNQVLKTPPFIFHLNDGRQIIDIESVPALDSGASDKIEYNAGDQYVSSPALLAFGAATGLLANGPGAPLVFPQATVLRERETFTWSRYYKVGLWAFLIFLFGLLLVNFFVYDHYFSLNKERDDNRQISREQESKMQKQLVDLQSREGFLRRLGWDQRSRLSFYADRIAGLVPGNTTLTELWINPVNKSVLGEGRGISFKKDTIQLAGTCDDPTELNQFTNNLKNIQNFKAVNILSYDYKKEIGSGVFFMEIITK